MKITYLDDKPAAKITYLDDMPAAVTPKQNPNLGDQFQAGVAQSPLLTDIGAAVAGLVNKVNPNFPNAEQYKQAGNEIAQSIPQPTGLGGKIVRGAGAAIPDIAASVPVVGAVGRGLQAVSKAPLLTRFGGKVAARALASPIAQMGAGMGAYQAGEKVLTGNPKEAIPAGLGAAASGVIFGGAGKLGTQWGGQSANKLLPKVATKIMPGVERLGSGLGQAGAAKIMGQDPLVAGALGAAFPSKYEGKVAKTADQKILDVVKRGVDKGIRPSVAGKPSASKMETYYEKSANGVKAIIANKKDLQFVDDKTGTLVNRLPQSVAEYAQAIEQTKNKVFERYNALAKQAGERGATFNAKPIVNKLKKVTVDLKHNPETRQYATKLISEIEELHGQDPSVIQARIQDLNNSLSSFYAGRASKAQAQIDASTANLMREELDNMITGATGKNYQEYKNIYGALKTAEKDINHRAIVLSRQNPRSLADLTDVFSGERILRGVLTANPGTIAEGMLMRGIKEFHKLVNNPDRTVKNMFSNTEKILNKLPKSTQTQGSQPSGNAVKPSGVIPPISPKFSGKTYQALPPSETIYGEGFEARKPNTQDYVFKKGRVPWNTKKR